MPTLYINNDGGNDSNDGSDATTNAKLTLASAMSAAASGDTIIIIGVGSTNDPGYTGDGTYGAVSTITASAYYSLPSSKDLTIVGDGTVILTNDGTNTSNGIVYSLTGTDGDFEFQNIQFIASSTNNYMIRWRGTGSCTLTSCVIDNNAKAIANAIVLFDCRTANMAFSMTDTTVTTDSATGSTCLVLDLRGTVAGTPDVTIDGCTCTFDEFVAIPIRFYGDFPNITITDNSFTGTGTASRVELITGWQTDGLALLSNTNFTFTGNTVTCSHYTGSGGGAGVKLVEAIGSGTGGSATISGNTFINNNGNQTGGLLLELGWDGAQDDADGNDNPLGPTTLYNNTFTYTSGSASHGVLLGFGCNDMTASYNTISGCDIGFVIKGTGNTVHHNKVYGGRALYFKSGQDSVVHHNSFYTTSGASIGFEKQATNGSFTSRDPSGNTIRDNIFGTEGDHVWENLVVEDDIYNTDAYNNAYMAGSSDWFNATSTFATFTLFKAAFSTSLGGDAANEDFTSRQISSDPFVDAANLDFNLTTDAKYTLNINNLNSIGAIDFVLGVNNFVQAGSPKVQKFGAF